ncbi:type 1 glutamine amidotransferase domain-containing protein [Methylocapsa polymorpha]|uniref:Type 1 glutamine amidotransferase domain-containing protein n=1 Tax=Methylocapsa polymorpha TaxID=3080828 RepID=A0ABZ0HRT8_9HYPH|nr:type 1 glutamine amidotransferase domain-containing protein [Methylocapsa sp. RX1]
MPTIREAKILIMATDGFEQSELMTPLSKLKEAGASVQVAAPNGPRIKGWNEKNWGETVDVDLDISAVDAVNYHCLILPGGQINPDTLRTNEAAIKLILDFLNEGKIVAAICHAPWLLVEAKAVEGRQLTSWRSIKTDVENAGGVWVDKPVVVDDSIITSRSPADLDAFVAKIIEEIETHEHLEGEPFRQSA